MAKHENTMNRDSYLFANFFLGLSVASGVWQVSVHFLIGLQIYSQSSAPNWYLATSLVSLIGFLFCLQYYHVRQYTFAFWTGLLVAVANVAMVGVGYALLLHFREFESYRLLLLLVFSGTSIAYTLALIFSEVSQRFWLKIAGIWGLILAVILMATYALILPNPERWLSETLDKINQGAFLASTLLPMLYILNFREEAKALPPPEATKNMNPSSAGFMSLVSLVAFGATLFFGFRLALQGYELTQAPGHVQLLANQFEARTYVSRRGEKLHYRLLRPLEYDPSQRYPLLVTLHGGAGWGTDNMRQLEQIDQLLASDSVRKKYPAFLFAPQIPPGTSFGGVSWLIPKDSLVFEAMGALEQEFSIDAKRRYVMGHSLGGFGTWYFIGTRPERFAAAMPFAGEGDPALAKNMVGVAVWAFHGALDRNVPVNGSRVMIAAIKKTGGTPRYSEFPNAGHGIWDEIETTPGLMEWLFAQKRE